ncbi:helix-turn-helix domain-containing protein [Bordetella sp. 02P26C-1]|nr:helix-turn-helix domain-containing protein [Bordetella sp. 02P26C-1]
MDTVSTGSAARITQPAGLIDKAALHSQAAHSALRYAVEAPSAQQPVFEGLIDTTKLSEGLIQHRVDARDLQGAAVRADLQPGLRIAVTVAGRADVSYDGYRLLLGPHRDGGAAGAMVALTEPARFVRQSRRGDIERSVSLTLSEAWLRERLGDTMPFCLEFARRHLSVHPWMASSQTVALVTQMLAPSALEGPLWRLYQESRCMALVVDALSDLDGAAMAPVGVTLRPRERVRMEQVRDLLDSGAADEMSLVEIARQACVSVNTLQRQFRAAWGKTVFAYLRDARLARARMALERDAVSVTEAALIAGYSSPANFATAFRQRYGIAPGQAGRRGD